jgi:hypothetical protein
VGLSLRDIRGSPILVGLTAELKHNHSNYEAGGDDKAGDGFHVDVGVLDDDDEG